MSQEQTTPFPLQVPIVERNIGLYGTFTDVELAAVVQTSENVAPPHDPLQHLLLLREQPYLRLFSAMDTCPRPELVAYRTAACLGATMVRRQAREAAFDLTQLRTTPGRNYLYFEDAALPHAFQKYGAWPIMTEDFTDPSHYRHYFSEDESAHIKDLQRRLTQNHVQFMEAAAGSSPDDLYGFFCRGLLDSLALYRQLAIEHVTAPASETVFDANRHEKLEAANVKGSVNNSPKDLAWRWRVGSLEGMRLSDGKVTPYAVRGTTTLAANTLITAVSRGVAGFVKESPDQKSATLLVLFKASEERFDLQNDDTLIVYESSSASGIFRALRSPLYQEEYPIYPSATVFGICRSGVASFLYDPEVTIDTHDSTLALAMKTAMNRSAAA